MSRMRNSTSFRSTYNIDGLDSLGGTCSQEPQNLTNKQLNQIAILREHADNCCVCKPLWQNETKKSQIFCYKLVAEQRIQTNFDTIIKCRKFIFHFINIISKLTSISTDNNISNNTNDINNKKRNNFSNRYNWPYELIDYMMMFMITEYEEIKIKCMYE